MVRAKFRVDRTESTLTTLKKDLNKGWDAGNMVTQELKTIVMSPVGANNPENATFWKYTPSGEIKLGTINPEAWQQFELGKEYYIDFTPAEA
jgi:hypothetical protein